MKIHKKIPKHFMSLDALMILINIFVFYQILSLASMNFKFLDPLKNALSGFDIYDMYYSQIQPEQTADTNIVIVNIGNLDRRGIAGEINYINSFNPKLIALDILFTENKDAESDSLLSDAFRKTKNLIMAFKLDNYNDSKENYDSFKTSIPEFNRYAKNGYANMPDDEKGGYRTIRRYMPFAQIKDSTVNSLTSAIISIYNPQKYSTLKKRNFEYEIINYKGNYKKFYTIDVTDLQDPEFNPAFLKDKIVLMGFMGSSLADQSLEDVFFTPMNANYAGRGFPDMYGVVIHANIISMILNDSYIDQMPFLVSIVFTFLLCLLNVIMIKSLNAKFPILASTLTKVALSFQTIGALYLGFFIFGLLKYKINLTLAMAAIVLVPSMNDFYHIYEIRLFNFIKRKITKKDDNTE